LSEPDAPVPSTHPASGRWPISPGAGAAAGTSAHGSAELIAWPLTLGARQLFEGDYPAAVAHLREALARQRIGEGLFRSEAAAILIVALAAAGQVDEAELLLADEPPDAVAVYPGLLPWAQSTVAAARGRPDAAALSLTAAEEARAVGGVLSAVAYLAQAARLGAPGQAASLLAELGDDFEPSMTSARALGIKARASGDGKLLLEAAERHAANRLHGEALELAQLAAATAKDASGSAGRAGLLVQQMRGRLQLPAPTFEPVVGLTRRELEVARMAARGLTDRDIAESLVVSVRTVESHLAAGYRKLGISSRRQLREVLAEMV
jgi:DNA-binding NarL/FixJ family response regulator